MASLLAGGLPSRHGGGRTGRGGQLRASVWLYPQELTAALDVEAEIRVRDDLPIFAGRGSIESFGVAPTLRIGIAPTPVLAFMVWGRDAIGLAVLDVAQHLEHDAPQPPRGIEVSPRDGTLVFHARLGPGASNRIHLLDPYSGAMRLPADPTKVAVPPDQQWPKLSGDGQWIYFQGSFNFVSHELWRIRPDGSEPEAVLGGASAPTFNGYPAPSSDGGRLVYATDTSPHPIFGELSVLDLATGVARDLGVRGTTVRWSPDDQLIAYRSTDSRLHTIRPDGSGDRVLASVTVRPAFDWSEGADWIVAATESYEAVRIEVATGQVQVLTELGEVHGVAALR